jgi:hypothetical protein
MEIYLFFLFLYLVHIFISFPPFSLGQSLGQIVAGPRQHSHSWFQVLQGSCPYFTVSRVWELCNFLHSPPLFSNSFYMSAPSFPLSFSFMVKHFLHFHSLAPLFIYLLHSILIPFISLFSLDWKNERRLMRITLLWIFPPNAARQQLGKHIPMAMNACTTE